MEKKLDKQQLIQNIFIWLDGKRDMTSAEEQMAFEEFTEIFNSVARSYLYNFQPGDAEDTKMDILLALIKTIRNGNVIENQELYLRGVIYNELKKLFGSKSDAYKVVQKKTYAEMLESLENSGSIYSNNIRVSVSPTLDGDSIDEYSIYGYIYDLALNNKKLDQEFILALLKKIDGPVEIDLLLNQIVNYRFGMKDITVSIDGDDGEESETPVTRLQIPDDQLMQDELADIALFADRVMRKIKDFVESEKKGEELFIKLLYLTMTTKTSKEIAKITGTKQKNVEYYTTERANNSTRSLINQWIGELTALLINRNRDEIILIFQNEIMGKMEVKYESYLKGIE